MVRYLADRTFQLRCGQRARAGGPRGLLFFARTTAARGAVGSLFSGSWSACGWSAVCRGRHHQLRKSTLLFFAIDFQNTFGTFFNHNISAISLLLGALWRGRARACVLSTQKSLRHIFLEPLLVYSKKRRFDDMIKEASGRRSGRRTIT